jgi:adenylate kinase family enzyme
MTPLIFINGAPGVGKTTVAKLLKEKLDSPYIDFGWLREFHLKRDWSNHSEKEEQMSFENLVFILKNYISYNYSNVIVTDLLEFRTQQISKLFSVQEYKIFTLIVNDYAVLKERVLDETRDSGFRNFERALEWNKEVTDRVNLINEIKIDNTQISPEDVVALIYKDIQV